ncbi:MAG: hypothetical protein HUJ26_06025 [Planctomycetaceae bacterium]|nr:hypothetical protein [Planctomycetaceae bacterium]
MQDDFDSHPASHPTKTALNPWKVAGWTCALVILGSVLACVTMAGLRSEGLTHVTVTALPQTEEPRDHKLPFIKKKEALPDYELVVNLVDGSRRSLGMKPDQSAKAGLNWGLNEPISLKEIVSLRLMDQDQYVSDTVAEIQFQDQDQIESGYRFEYETRRSMGVGLKSFFQTPIGMAISAGFTLSIIILILAIFCAAGGVL